MKNDQQTTPPDGGSWHAQPQWRNDFPIDWPHDELVARRDFTKFLVLTSLAFAVGQVWIFVENLARRRRGQPPIVAIGRVDQLAIGQAVTFAYPAPHDDCILVRTGENRFVAFSQKCTHLSCAVTPDVKNNCFHCPCHEGFFDLATGRPIAGPPRRPLPRVHLQIRDGILYATGVEVRTI